MSKSTLTGLTYFVLDLIMGPFVELVNNSIIIITDKPRQFLLELPLIESKFALECLHVLLNGNLPALM
jgi:hypothetical protein